MHDKVRFLVTLVGVVFAVILIGVQTGLYIGFSVTTSGIIDHAPADIWVCSAGVRNFDITRPLHERRYYQILSVPGIEWAQKYLVQFANWKKPKGGEESVEVIGFDVDNGRGGPWNVIRGDVRDLEIPDRVFIDELYKDKLEVSEIGDSVEINGHKAVVAGFTSGIRSFTTSPFVFTSFKNAQTFTRMHESELTYVLVKAAPGVNVPDLKKAIKERIGDAVDVFTQEEFSRQTRHYWMYTTGAGMSVLIAAILGLIVGTVIVAQTLYATTMDHISEYGTLRAMGAPNSYIYSIIVKQAVISAIIGYVLGIAMTYLVIHGASRGAAPIVMPPLAAVGVFFATLVMCVTAAYVSVFKVTRLDPAMVFK